MKKILIDRHFIFENLIYLIFWLIILLSPIFSHIFRQTSPIPWKMISREWLLVMPILLMFILHNFILFPLLCRKKRYIWYVLSALIIMIAASISNPFVFNKSQNTDIPLSIIQEGIHSPMSEPDEMRPEMKPNIGHPIDDSRPDYRPKGTKYKPTSPLEMPSQVEARPPYRPAFFFPIKLGPFLNNLIVAILIICFNIAIKLIFKSSRDEKHLKELEKQNLSTELEYLKHQINPHFFMNTLNNIHALIDIDSEKAKESIIQLSKIMRYVLYDSCRQAIPFSEEITFLKNYIELMKIRYTDSVDITVEIKEDMPDVKIPPLIFISFVENAFKYGISYSTNSFVHINLCMNPVKNMMFFAVSNSIPKEACQNHLQGGIGIENAKKRLDLLFKDKYFLDIQQDSEIFSVSLMIPIKLS